MTADPITGDIRTTRIHDSAHKHVAGSAVYVDDIPTTDDTLVVLIGQSPHAHARITKMDLSAVVAADRRFIRSESEPNPFSSGS